MVEFIAVGMNELTQKRSSIASTRRSVLICYGFNRCLLNFFTALASIFQPKNYLEIFRFYFTATVRIVCAHLNIIIISRLRADEKVDISNDKRCFPTAINQNVAAVIIT